MRVKILSFRYSSTLGGFDEAALQDFVRDKEIVSFREHFYRVQDVPHLTCIVTYQDEVVSPTVASSSRRSSSTPRRKGSAPDPAADLGESDRTLFNTLREWRLKTARAEGVPPYVILTNKELLAVIEKKPESITALGNVEGLGPGRLKRHGQEILSRLNGKRNEPARETTPLPVYSQDAVKNGTAVQ